LKLSGSALGSIEFTMLLTIHEEPGTTEETISPQTEEKVLFKKLIASAVVVIVPSTTKEDLTLRK